MKYKYVQHNISANERSRYVKALKVLYGHWKKERDQRWGRMDAYLVGAPHKYVCDEKGCRVPDDCPTYYDECNCTVETLAFNIERAERAEEERDKHLASVLGLRIKLETEKEEANKYIANLEATIVRLRDMDAKHLADFDEERRRYEARLAAAEPKNITKMRSQLEAALDRIRWLESRKWIQCTSKSNDCLGGCASLKEHDAYILSRKHCRSGQDIDGLLHRLLEWMHGLPDCTPGVQRHEAMVRDSLNQNNCYCTDATESNVLITTCGCCSAGSGEKCRHKKRE